MLVRDLWGRFVCPDPTPASDLFPRAGTGVSSRMQPRGQEFLNLFGPCRRPAVPPVTYLVHITIATAPCGRTPVSLWFGPANPTFLDRIHHSLVAGYPWLRPRREALWFTPLKNSIAFRSQCHFAEERNCPWPERCCRYGYPAASDPVTCMLAYNTQGAQ